MTDDKKNEYKHKSVIADELYDDEEGITKFTPELLTRDFMTIEEWHPLNKLAHIGNALKYAQIGFDLVLIKILDDLEIEPEELDALKKSINIAFK